MSNIDFVLVLIFSVCAFFYLIISVIHNAMEYIDNYNSLKEYDIDDIMEYECSMREWEEYERKHNEEWGKDYK